MEYRRLGTTELTVSSLGFGASAVGGMFEKVTEAEGLAAIYRAFERGITYFDTSPAYGRPDSPYGPLTSETILGKGLKTFKREDYVLSTKAGKNASLPPALDFRYDSILKSVEASIKRLHSGYIDVAILHDIEYDKGRYLDRALSEGVEAMHALKKSGKIRYFGVSCYAIPVLEMVIDTYHPDIILSHNHYTLLDDQLEQLLPGMKRKGISLINASPFASGLLTSGVPPDWYPIEKEELELVRMARDFCKQYNTTIERLALQFPLLNPEISTTLFSASSKALVDQNVNYAEEEPDIDLLMQVRKILKPLHNRDFDFGGYNH